MLDDEHVNMIATCERLSTRLTGPDIGFINGIKNSAVALPAQQSIRLRSLWDIVTVNGTVDTVP